jgi:hypothetical protein
VTIKPISIDDMDGFSIDDSSNRLYWRGREVVTELSLPRWVHWAAVITAISTFAIAIFTAIPVLVR